MLEQLRAALGELAESGGLEVWCDLDELTRQIGSVLWASSLDWANGWVDDDGFVARERLGVAYVMLGVTRGETREGFLQLVQGGAAGALADAPTAPAKVTRLEARR